MGGGSMLGAGTKGLVSATAVSRGIKPKPKSKPPSDSSIPAATLNPSLRTTAVKSYSHHLRICNQEEEQPRFNFGPVPSKEEAQQAVFALQQLVYPMTYPQIFGDGFPSPEKDAIDERLVSTELVERVSSAELELNRHPKLLQSQGLGKVFYAFRLLFEPLVQRIVVSLSSDKAVWDAVMKNVAVQELKESFCAARTKEQRSEGRQSSRGSRDVGTIIMRWILENTKTKIMELIDKITKLVNELFHSREREKDVDIFHDVVRSSFMLSIMVFIVIIAGRLQ